MKEQEQLIQRQDTQICELNVRIKKLEMEKAEILNKQQQQQEQQMPLLPSVPSLSNIAGLPILDDVTLQQLSNPTDPLPSTSLETQSSFAVEKMLKPESLKFLPKYAAGMKKEPESLEVESSTVTLPVTAEEQLQVIPQSASNVIYIPKKSALVLVPPTQKRVLSKCSNPGTPIPKDVRDPTRHYCENCSCHYAEKSDLNKHMKFMCMKTQHDYICDGCQKGFHTEYGVREHYYQEHKKEYLYFCPLCNKGFYHKSKKSLHKKACPNKDGKEQFTPRAPYDAELELTFKRRQRMEVNIPEEVARIAMEEEERCKAAEELEKVMEKEKEGDATVILDAEVEQKEDDDEEETDEDD